MLPKLKKLPDWKNVAATKRCGLTFYVNYQDGVEPIQQAFEYTEEFLPLKSPILRKIWIISHIQHSGYSDRISFLASIISSNFHLESTKSYSFLQSFLNTFHLQETENASKKMLLELQIFQDKSESLRRRKDHPSFCVYISLTMNKRIKGQLF